MRRIYPLAMAAWLFGTSAGIAFNGHSVTDGPLKLFISDIPVVTNRNQTQIATVRLTNTAAERLVVNLELKDLVDDCRAVGPTKKRVELAPKGAAHSTFEFQCGPGTFSAHYPLHVYATGQVGEQKIAAHAVQIFLADFAAEARARPLEFLPIAVPASGGFALASVRSNRVAWNYLGRPPVYLPAGWQGSDAQSSASFSRGAVTRGEARQALHLHPPYRGGVGSVFVEYRLKLPKTQPLKFSFYHAIRDHSASEPPSDGVTFRVWADNEKLFERHTDAKVWQPGEVDLSRFAGREILLRLESHPGPKNNTTCDSCYWGDPTITAGAPPAMLTAAQKASRAVEFQRALETGKVEEAGIHFFNLQGGARAAVLPGPRGLADGLIGFSQDGKTAVFEGLEMAVQNQRLSEWPSAAVVRKFEATRSADGRLKLAHHLELNEKQAVLLAELWTEGPGLRIKVTCPEYLTDLALGRADRLAETVYYGHGYAIKNPKTFRAGGGGHNLATSHVGFEFAGGLSLLAACDTPPDHLLVDPDQRLYQLHTHPDSVLTFVPGTKGAFDCAIRYRPLYDKKPSAGVAPKMGRFVFDLWGGRYAENTAQLERGFAYGLTNALVLMHVWQRWGYDYRLPDIYPPDPKLGTLEDLQALGRACASRGVLWGLHDNYIDFYPDAEGYSYDHIVFTADGRPMRAWLNEGREAQSYRWRPDRFLPFLKRNMELIQPALKPSASFVDVFTSINAFDFYDRQGKLHSKLETRQAWGDAFAYIRDICGHQAPTTSEAGSDHLIGWLDGADCQFLELSDRGRRFYNVAPCADWERVPWFDAVNHTRFSLHGVGYSGRYQGDRSRPRHGIDSDDYLSAEILTGHALMVDRSSMVREAARKYWLAQSFIEAVARDEIASVEYAGGDIHRQIIRWNSGAQVWVNRGAAPWTVERRILPRFGYLARAGAVESSVEQIGGNLVEQARGKDILYAHGRGHAPDAALRIQPLADRVEYLGGREFRLHVSWEAAAPAPKDLQVFYHFSKPRPGRRAEYLVAGGGSPTPPTSQWQGKIATGGAWTLAIPEDHPTGEYEITVGLYDAKNRGRRYRLAGDEDGDRRIRIGTLVVEGKTNVSNIRLVKPAAPPPPSPPEMNLTPTDFGWARTVGGLRVVVEPKALLVLPLPDSPAFALTLRPEKIAGRAVTVKGLEAVDSQGRKTRDATFQAGRGEITFSTDPNDFAYRVSLQ